MKQAKNIAKAINFNQAVNTEAKQITAVDKKIAIQLINKIFKELEGCCTAWSYTFPSDNPDKLKAAKLQWVKTIVEQGIYSDLQINAGMAKVRQLGSAYVPTPGEFVKYCKPQLEDLGLPSAEVAYLEACRHSHNPAGANWSHEAVYKAAKATGWFELKTLEERQALPLFTHNYEVVTRRVLAGEAISDIPKALPGQTMKTPTEQNQAYHDAQQQAHIKQAGLNQLTNSSEAITKIRQMIKKGGN